MRRLLPVLVAAALLPGCILAAAVVVAAAVTAGAVVYANNVASCEYGAPLDRCWEAAQAAVADLSYPAGTRSKDHEYGEIKTKAADGRQVVVVIRKTGDATTRVEVRVGDFESDRNRESAEAVHAAVAKRLGVKSGEKK